MGAVTRRRWGAGRRYRSRGGAGLSAPLAGALAVGLAVALAAALAAALAVGGVPVLVSAGSDPSAPSPEAAPTRPAPPAAPSVGDASPVAAGGTSPGAGVGSPASDATAPPPDGGAASTPLGAADSVSAPNAPAGTADAAAGVSPELSAPGFVDGPAFGDVPTPRAVPYVPMWTEVNNPADAQAVNRLSGAALTGKLDELASWYVHFHSEASNAFPLGDASRVSGGTTLADKLAGRGAMVSSYRNGSYVSQATSGQLNFGEAADLEGKAPLAIGTWWPGHRSASSGTDASAAARLTAGSNAAQTSITVTSAAAFKPPGAADTWPYFPSRGTGAGGGAARSANTHDVVSWVRVDDEIMRVRSVSGDAASVTLGVDRGFFGTAAAAHGASARVMSPVYIGSATATTFDTGYAGAPNVDRTDKALRYGIKIWQADGYGWIAGRIKSTFGAGAAAPYLQGYNAVWLDVSSCATYNNSDALGQPVAPWSEPYATIVDANKWKAHQLTKLAGLRAAFDPASGYQRPRFLANNLATQGAATTACRNDEMAPGNFDGGVLEHWLQDPSLWAVQMDQSFQIQTQDLPAVYWVKTAENSSGIPVEQYKRLAYGSLLLSKRDGASRYQFGGMSAGLREPDQLFRWDFGAAVSTPATLAAVATQACTGATVYRRDFAKGFVLVNPSGAAATCSLGGGAFDVVGQTAGEPTPRTAVAVGARDAAFLLYE